MEYNGETFDELLASGGFAPIVLDAGESLTNYGEYMLDDFDQSDSEAIWEDFQDRYSDIVAAGGGGIAAAKQAFDSAWADAQSTRNEGSHNASINTTAAPVRPSVSADRSGLGQPERRDYLPNRKPEYVQPRALPEPPIHRSGRGGSEPRRGLSAVVRSVGRFFRRKR